MIQVITFATIDQKKSFFPRLFPRWKKFKVNKSESSWDLNKLCNRKTTVLGNTHNLDELEITGYIRGDEIVHSPKLMWKNFDSVLFFNESKNIKAKRKRLIFIGQQSGKESVLVVAKYKVV